MIIKKGELPRPKFTTEKWPNFWGFFLNFSKNIWGFFCFLTKKIWGFRINIVNLHPINRIDYGKSF